MTESSSKCDTVSRDLPLSETLLEYGNELRQLVPVCEHCVRHPAVYYCYAIWPTTYICRPCLSSSWYDLRLHHMEFGWGKRYRRRRPKPRTECGDR